MTDSLLFLTALTRLGDEQFTGTLRAEGARVGGTIVLDSGLVIAAETAAAPGLEPLLLRSGRISGEDWTEAFADAAPQGRLRAALVERGLLGSASLQVLTQTAAVDAVFALALAEVHTCLPDPAGVSIPPLVPIVPGLETGWVVRETQRRLEVAAGWRELGLDPWVRPRPTEAEPPLDAGRVEVLARVNGRRACRDIAFVLGRGLFAVMADLRLLLQDGQIDVRPAAPTVVPPPPGPAAPAPPARPASPRTPPRPTDLGASPGPAVPTGPRQPAAPAPSPGPGPVPPQPGPGRGACQPGSAAPPGPGPGAKQPAPAATPPGSGRGPKQLGPKQLGPKQLGPKQLGPKQLGPKELGPKEPAPVPAPPGGGAKQAGPAGRSVAGLAALTTPEGLAALAAAAQPDPADGLEPVADAADAAEVTDVETGQRRRLLPRWSGRGQA